MLRILFTMTVVLVSFAAQAADSNQPVFDKVIKTGTIRCAYATWPPYLIKDPNTSTLSGLSYDYMMEIGRILDLKIEWTEEAGWGNYIEGLNNHRYDLFCVSDWAVGERLKFATVTRPTLYSIVYAYVRSDDGRFDGDITKINKKDVKIAAIDGDTSFTSAKLHFPDATINAISQNSDGAQLLLEVATRKSDIAVVDENIAKEFLANNPGSIRKVKDIPPVQIYPEVFSMKQGERNLKDLLDGAIRLISDGQFGESLVKKYGVVQKVPRKSYAE